MSMPRRQLMVTGVFFGLIILLYVYAVFSAFEPIESVTDYGELVAFVLTSIGGLAVWLLCDWPSSSPA